MKKVEEKVESLNKDNLDSFFDDDEDDLPQTDEFNEADLQNLSDSEEEPSAG